MMKGSGNVWMEDMQAKTEDGGELSRQGEGRSPLHKKMGLGNHEVGILYEPPLKSQLSQVTGSRLCPNRQPVTQDFPSLPRKIRLPLFSPCPPVEPHLEAQKCLTSILLSLLDSAPSPSPGTSWVFLSTSVLQGPGMTRRESC